MTTPPASLSLDLARSLGDAPARRLVRDQRQDDFAAVLGRAGRGAAAGQTPAQRARSAAEEFVSVALVQPVLKQLRESNRTPPPFGPGEGEKTFGSIADAQVARNIVRAAQFNLVGAVERRLLQGAPSAEARP